MLSDKKKVAIVGVGMVGMSFAYALLNQNICDELVSTSTRSVLGVRLRICLTVCPLRPAP